MVIELLQLVSLNAQNLFAKTGRQRQVSCRKEVFAVGAPVHVAMPADIPTAGCALMPGHS